MLARKPGHKSPRLHADGIQHPERQPYTGLELSLLDPFKVRRIIGNSIHKLPKRHPSIFPFLPEGNPKKARWFFHYGSIAQDSVISYWGIEIANTARLSLRTRPRSAPWRPPERENAGISGPAHRWPRLVFRQPRRSARGASPRGQALA